jgi:hypothetical protein
MDADTLGRAHVFIGWLHVAVTVYWLALIALQMRYWHEARVSVPAALTVALASGGLQVLRGLSGLWLTRGSVSAAVLCVITDLAAAFLALVVFYPAIDVLSLGLIIAVLCVLPRLTMHARVARMRRS